MKRTFRTSMHFRVLLGHPNFGTIDSHTNHRRSFQQDGRWPAHLGREIGYCFATDRGTERLYLAFPSQKSLRELFDDEDEGQCEDSRHLLDEEGQTSCQPYVVPVGFVSDCRPGPSLVMVVREQILG